jgi:HlyD family secretion protein
LFREKVISQFDLNLAEDSYLNKQRPLKQLERVIIDLQTQKKNKEKEILELDRQATELESDFNQAFNTLVSQIETWKSNFMLVSPASGNLNYAEPLQENAQVTESSELFYVIPPGNKLLGVARVPQVNSGQIRKGQPVIIKFAGYPFERYGTVNGVVEDIAWVTSKDSTFLTQVRLPGGITTNNGKRLVFRNGMMGTAEIITRDSRLIDHFIYEIRLALAQ